MQIFNLSSFFRKLILNKKNSFLESICSFYLGFISGNLFGTFLNFLRNKIAWDGTILFFIIIFFEFLNYILHHKFLKKQHKCKLLIIFKNMQIGLLLGFFIDAFKVGS